MLRSVVMRILILVLVIKITVSSMMLVIAMIIMVVKSMRVTQIDQVGRNITRAFWDYYKIVAVIPLEVAKKHNNKVVGDKCAFLPGLIGRRMRDPKGVARSAKICRGHPKLQHGSAEGGGTATTADCADL